MRRLLTGVLVSTLLLSTSLSASAAPWVRKAVVDGDYGGHYRRTECTYSECSKRTAAYRLGWVFTPVERGIRMVAVAQDYRMFLRWVPGGGYYVGTNMAEPGRARLRAPPVDRDRVGRADAPVDGVRSVAVA